MIQGTGETPNGDEIQAVAILDFHISNEAILERATEVDRITEIHSDLGAVQMALDLDLGLAPSHLVSHLVPTHLVQNHHEEVHQIDLNHPDQSHQGEVHQIDQSHLDRSHPVEEEEDQVVPSRHAQNRHEEEEEEEDRVGQAVRVAESCRECSSSSEAISCIIPRAKIKHGDD